jgi:hypothetical protein
VGVSIVAGVVLMRGFILWLLLTGSALAAPHGTIIGTGSSGGGVTNQDTLTRTGAIPAKGALVYDTDLERLFVGDGLTFGGVLSARALPQSTIIRGGTMPAAGVLVWDTDLSSLWVGDGFTLGGVAAGGGGGGSTVTLHHIGLSGNQAIATGGTVAWDTQTPATGGLVIVGGVVTIPFGKTAMLSSSLGPSSASRFDFKFVDVTGAPVDIGSHGSAYPPSLSGSTMRASGGASAFVDATAASVDVKVEIVFADGGAAVGAGWSYMTAIIVE